MKLIHDRTKSNLLKELHTIQKGTYNVDSILRSRRNLLLNLLLEKFKVSAGNIIGPFIDCILTQIFDLCNYALVNGEVALLITAVLDLEMQVNNLVLKLEEEGHFKEMVHPSEENFFKSVTWNGQWNS